MSIGSVLNRICFEKGIPQKEISNKLKGFSPQRISNYFRGKADPPNDFYDQFRAEYNIDLKEILAKESKGIAAKPSALNPIPVFDLDLKPVTGLDFFNFSELVAYYMDTPLYNDCFAAVRVPGAAMSPVFNPSDVVAIKRIMNFDTVPLGEPFFIITDEQRLLRYIRLNEAGKGDTWILRAENKQNDDMVIKKKEVKYLFQVKGKMTRL